jgi:hypothetical protein
LDATCRFDARRLSGIIAAISGLAASLDHCGYREHKRDAEDVAYDACIADAALVEYDERLPTAP